MSNFLKKIHKQTPQKHKFQPEKAQLRKITPEIQQ